LIAMHLNPSVVRSIYEEQARDFRARTAHHDRLVRSRRRPTPGSDIRRALAAATAGVRRLLATPAARSQAPRPDPFASELVARRDPGAARTG
jgi:hypothetical protein